MSRILESPWDFNGTPCWLWEGCKGIDGYGSMRFKGKPRRVHRVAYELWKGPIPEGLQLDHLCRVRACCNPAHLEPVTCKENVRRGDQGKYRAEINHAKTHCPSGHPYDEANTYYYKNQRICRACQKVHTDTWRAKLGQNVGSGRGGYQRAKTHCPKGHEYTPENTYVYVRANGKSGRSCKTCDRLRSKVRSPQGPIPCGLL